jgi:L-fucose isomerase
MRIESQTGGVRRMWDAQLNPGAVGVAWLGQAGFAFRFAHDAALQTSDGSAEGRQYHLAIVPAEFIAFPGEVGLAKGPATMPERPIAFARLREPPETFLERFPCNHIHGVYGNCTSELMHIARILGNPFKVYS